MGGRGAAQVRERTSSSEPTGCCTVGQMTDFMLSASYHNHFLNLKKLKSTLGNKFQMKMFPRLDVVHHAYNASTLEAEVGRCLRSGV